ncbi:hypothetical protein KAR91_07335 [Candidatus Pacearchaeota archaeon]|nr:hypothetical protein [Candidatus Pacearchaeota archaeon]
MMKGMEKRKFTTMLREDLIREVKILAIRRDVSANKLVEEGIEYVLRKYQKEGHEGKDFIQK